MSEPDAPPPGASTKSIPTMGPGVKRMEHAPSEPHWAGDHRWSESATAVDSLGRIGVASLPALVELLHGQEEPLRIASARAIALMGPTAESAVPDLVAAISDPSAVVRKNVVRALGQMGPAAEPAIGALVKEARAEPGRRKSKSRSSEYLPRRPPPRAANRSNVPRRGTANDEPAMTAPDRSRPRAQKSARDRGIE